MKFIIGFDMFTGDLKKSEVRDMLDAPGVAILQCYPLRKDFYSVDLEGEEKDLKALLKTVQQDIDPEINIDEILNQKMSKEDFEELENTTLSANLDAWETLASFHEIVTAGSGDEDDDIEEEEDYHEDDEPDEHEQLSTLKEAVKKAKDGHIEDLENWLLANDIEDVNFRDDYSGRGMYGNTSKVAFDTGVHPQSDLGKLLSKVLTVDSMGHDFIYYSRS